jgi:hypothetical protein
VLSCLLVLQLYQEAGVVAEGFTGVPVFQVCLRLRKCSTLLVVTSSVSCNGCGVVCD